MPARTPADRLDEAVDRVLSGKAPLVDDELRPLVDTAQLLRTALPPIPAGAAFAKRLAARLDSPGRITRLADGTERLIGRAETVARDAVRDRGRLIATGAVSSVAGAAVAGVAVWVVTRRGP
jgi:hypothetical protein